MNSSLIELGTAVSDALFVASLRAAALIAVAGLVLFVIRPQRPAARHAVWTAALWGMLLLPLLAVLSLPGDLVPAVTLETAIALPPGAGLGSEELPGLAHGVGSDADWRGLAGLLSMLVTSILLLRSAVGWARAMRLIARAEEISEPRAQRVLRSLLATVELKRPPRLVSSAETGTPAVFGCFRPTIILPATWAGWSAEKLRTVLSHELTHVARGDAWTMALASFNAAVLWFHPLAVWLRVRLRALAEMACDDQTMLSVQDREGYAELLLEMARAGQSRRALGATSPAMAHASRVSQRIERILGDSEFRSGVIGAGLRRRLTVAALSVTAALSLVSVTLGQGGGVTLAGSVQDASGARIPGALVKIVDPARDLTEATTTGADGFFRLGGLAPSEGYEIEVRARGFRVGKKSVDLSADTQVDIVLEVGRIEEEIVVAGRRPADADLSRSSGPSSRVGVGGKVKPAKLLQAAPPIYPGDAEREGVEGTVILEAVINIEGTPVGLKAVNSAVDPRLVTAAMDAVRTWRYQPVLPNGEPVEVVTTISVVFQLP